MKIYIIRGRDPHQPFSWVERIAYRKEIDAIKEAQSLQDCSIDEEEGSIYYYSVVELEVIQ